MLAGPHRPASAGSSNRLIAITSGCPCPKPETGALPEAYVAMGEIQFSKKDWAAGCQSYAFALSKLKAQSVPREQLNAMLKSSGEDVEALARRRKKIAGAAAKKRAATIAKKKQR